jgi:hypothetical protein
MAILAEKYAMPQELLTFVESGFLEVVSEDEAKRTVEFHIPAKRSTDRQGRITSYSVVWIHPNYNADFCHFYNKTPGDLPNFYAEQDTTDVGSDQIDGLDTVDDLVEWLRRFRDMED